MSREAFEMVARMEEQTPSLQGMRAKEQLVDAELVRSLLAYDPETGQLTWAVHANARAPKGSRAGFVQQGKRGERGIGIRGRHYPEHRVVWLHVYGEWPSAILDHINGDPSDNRIANLRLSSPRLNMQNQRRPHKRSSTGLLGAYRRTGPLPGYVSRISINGKVTHIGFFDTAEEAHAAYIEAKRKHHEGNTL